MPYAYLSTNRWNVGEELHSRPIDRSRSKRRNRTRNSLPLNLCSPTQHSRPARIRSLTNKLIQPFPTEARLLTTEGWSICPRQCRKQSIHQPLQQRLPHATRLREPTTSRLPQRCLRPICRRRPPPPQQHRRFKRKDRRRSLWPPPHKLPRRTLPRRRLQPPARHHPPRE